MKKWLYVTQGTTQVRWYDTSGKLVSKYGLRIRGKGLEVQLPKRFNGLAYEAIQRGLLPEFLCNGFGETAHLQTDGKINLVGYTLLSKIKKINIIDQQAGILHIYLCEQPDEPTPKPEPKLEPEPQPQPQPQSTPFKIKITVKAPKSRGVSNESPITGEGDTGEGDTGEGDKGENVDPTDEITAGSQAARGAGGGDEVTSFEDTEDPSFKLPLSFEVEEPDWKARNTKIILIDGLVQKGTRITELLTNKSEVID